jgi:hypothetical protein
MRERVTLVDGRVTIESQEGKGTVIRAVIPAHPESAHAPLSEAG